MKNTTYKPLEIIFPERFQTNIANRFLYRTSHTPSYVLDDASYTSVGGMKYKVGRIGREKTVKHIRYFTYDYSRIFIIRDDQYERVGLDKTSIFEKIDYNKYSFLVQEYREQTPSNILKEGAQTLPAKYVKENILPLCRKYGVVPFVEESLFIILSRGDSTKDLTITANKTHLTITPKTETQTKPSVNICSILQDCDPI